MPSLVHIDTGTFEISFHVLHREIISRPTAKIIVILTRPVWARPQIRSAPLDEGSSFLVHPNNDWNDWILCFDPGVYKSWGWKLRRPGRDQLLRNKSFSGSIPKALVMKIGPSLID